MKVREISGYALLFVGCVLFLELLLPVRLPLVLTACAVFLIWAGACLTTGKRLVLGAEPVEPEHPEGQPLVRQCVLQRGTIDLTDVAQLPEYVQVRAFLGSVTVRLPVDAQVVVQKEGLMCLLTTPDSRATLLGEDRMTCGSHDQSAPRLYLEAYACLGAIRLVLG